jgi:hypothetical protein
VNRVERAQTPVHQSRRVLENLGVDVDQGTAFEEASGALEAVRRICDPRGSNDFDGREPACPETRLIGYIVLEGLRFGFGYDQLDECRRIGVDDLFSDRRGPRRAPRSRSSTR